MSVDDDVKQLQLVDVNGDDEISMTNKATYDHLVELIHTMPPSYREACRLFYVENLKVKEIAEILNIPVNTIKSYLFRMRKRIKKLL